MLRGTIILNGMRRNERSANRLNDYGLALELVIVRQNEVFVFNFCYFFFFFFFFSVGSIVNLLVFFVT